MPPPCYNIVISSFVNFIYRPQCDSLSERVISKLIRETKAAILYPSRSRFDFLMRSGNKDAFFKTCFNCNGISSKGGGR